MGMVQPREHLHFFSHHFKDFWVHPTSVNDFAHTFLPRCAIAHKVNLAEATLAKSANEFIIIGHKIAR